MFKISVIIPVFKDWDRLRICLESLKNQEGVLDLFEVIVVNNEAGAKQVDLGDFPYQLKLVDELSPGSYAARNHGVSLAKGKAYLFTDSDCIPNKDWIKQAIDLLENASQSVFAGKIELFSKADNVFVDFDRAFAFPNERYVAKENFGVTANLLVRKEVVEAVGDFNSKMMTGGDSEFCNRAVRAGFQISYAPLMIIKHPSRESWDELATKARRFGGRLPKSPNRLMVFVKLLGKFRIRISDHQDIWNLSDRTFTRRLSFSLIKQSLRWIEAMESMGVFLGKKPGRL
ncbi:Glycosyltransferase, GT2 family [Algoriphagus faecimaris]|uniref:Glycosyltransferase, GT2 family n=1 Tax=Algoriphagus faecimaris TaxID=686796 RepID=A0A1G6PVQ1_9BACT|nr:glycosyltransferase [Algoriphagus faecimaris]SDC84282.1 Glycosyltransferase, GT2 family [Algoriphagus faecimaris]